MHSNVYNWISWWSRWGWFSDRALLPEILSKHRCWLWQQELANPMLHIMLHKTSSSFRRMVLSSWASSTRGVKGDEHMKFHTFVHLRSKDADKDQVVSSANWRWRDWCPEEEQALHEDLVVAEFKDTVVHLLQKLPKRISRRYRHRKILCLWWGLLKTTKNGFSEVLHTQLHSTAHN